MLKHDIQPLTYAEEKVLDFLEGNKGIEFANPEIEHRTGIRYYLINDIIDNLRWKGYKIKTAKGRDVHHMPSNSLVSYLILSIYFFLVLSMFGWAFLQYLDEEPTQYQIETTD